MKIRTLIIDDEPLARRRILSLLQSDPAFEVVGECGNGKDAVEKILELKPDLVFLDVQMPKLDGFGVLEAVAPTHLPSIIFVTAFDQYAVKAFDAHAVDYLLKPFKQERFLDAMVRAKIQFQSVATSGNGAGEENQKLLSLLRHVNTDSDRLVVRCGGKVVFLRSSEIEWIEAAANYIKLYSQQRVFTVREKISSLEEALPAGKFLRIHRSVIVNLSMVQEIQPCGGGEFVVVLRSGRELPLGRTYRSKIDELIHQLR
jgi:two-component system, LytTR family, response regulator